MFEILRRDGMARIGLLDTASGKLETPALLPVINPKLNTVTPQELYHDFGFRGLITNSYIIRNNEDLRQRAQSQGLHAMLDFPGVIMTDSGTFQSHMYGEVEVSNEEIIEFQKSIGTDIGTVLDIFAEPYWTREQTESSVHTTLERTQKAAGMKGDMMLAGVVQGSVYSDLREHCARSMATMAVDVHPIGGVVPLMEQYRYEELVDVIMASKKGLSPDRPVHLFGAGHPMLLALATLLGCDLFDSASYAKFARDDRMMFIDGTHRLADMQSLYCQCPACIGHDLASLRALDDRTRMVTIAKHNLYEIKNEMELVKRAILEGRLWELAETRCRSHPSLLSALRRLRVHQEHLEHYEPLSRDGAIFYTGSETRNRPAFYRYHRRMMETYVPVSEKVMLFPEGGKPYSRHYAEAFARARSRGYQPVVASPFGPVPAELDEVYPLAQSLMPTQNDMETESFIQESVQAFLDRFRFREVAHFDGDIEAGDERSDCDLQRAVAVARYQFGPEAAEALFREPVELVMSRNTGKIRNVISDGEHVLSMRAADGLYTLRVEGARRVLPALPSPRMRVIVHDDAAPYNMEGKNVFNRFVVSGDHGLHPMDEVMVVDGNDRLLATGRAVLTLEEMLSFQKGIAVKIRDGVGRPE
ncbi:MAG: tRNA guanosine(15) transglycosylase TgtA [Candidatus Methanomethylophilaceae archaeon]|nr:tRNA guanosine(15) transglycosylase TgtA [Candidatus Methanomethylophilaceae archaeon]